MPPPAVIRVPMVVVDDGSLIGTSSGSRKRNAVILDLFGDERDIDLGSYLAARTRSINLDVKRKKMELHECTVNHRLAMIKRCKEFVDAHPLWNREKIIKCIPQFEDVLDLVMEERQYVSRSCK